MTWTDDYGVTHALVPVPIPGWHGTACHVVAYVNGTGDIPKLIRKGVDDRGWHGNVDCMACLAVT